MRTVYEVKRRPGDHLHGRGVPRGAHLVGHADTLPQAIELAAAGLDMPQHEWVANANNWLSESPTSYTLRDRISNRPEMQGHTLHIRQVHVAETDTERIALALDLAAMYGGGDDQAWHLAWVIDQMVRRLTGDQYPQWIDEVTADDDGIPDPDAWSIGIPP